MKIVIITVGKAHDPHLKDAIATYQNRLIKHRIDVSWHIVPSSSVQQESAEILKKCGGEVIVLDERGISMTTPAFAQKLERYQNQSIKQITFIIGGAYGVDENVKQRADFMWSLSELVFPHQIVRLILIEQLYRAYDILTGGKYHHI